jgi:glycosyltransferase involved in cell wall biosynthesis
VILTGYVSDEHLAALYTGAHALVIAADEEGFGLPAVEALACGTPVVACQVAALREVLYQRVTFVPNCDLPALLAAAEAAQRPAPPAPAWTWQDVARATWRVYEHALAQAGERRTAGRRRRAAPAVAAAAAEEALTQ